VHVTKISKHTKLVYLDSLKLLLVLHTNAISNTCKNTEEALHYHRVAIGRLCYHNDQETAETSELTAAPKKQIITLMVA